MPERIGEVALPMDSPPGLVILNIVKTPGCACVQGTCDQAIRVVAKHLDSRGRDPKLGRASPTIVGWLSQEKRRTCNLQAGH